MFDITLVKKKNSDTLPLLVFISLERKDDWGPIINIFLRVYFDVFWVLLWNKGTKIMSCLNLP